MSLPEVYPPGQRTPPPARRWTRSSGALAPALAGLGLVLAGILFGRVEIAGLGLPLLLGLAWVWPRRPTSLGRVELTAPDRADTDQADTDQADTDQNRADGRLRAFVRWEPADGVEQLYVVVSAPGHRPAQAVLARPADSVRSVEVSIRSVRTGRRAIFAVSHAEGTAGQVLAVEPATTRPLDITVLPHARALRELPLPPRLQGLTGPHDSARPGDGGDLRDVNLFAPGDRLRRIDWRVTARQAARGGPGPITELYVRRTFSTADATVMLVLDSRDEVGSDVTTWGDLSRLREDEQTSLDHAREAAATVARCYLEAGDRVGLEDLGRLRRPMSPAGGRRQLQRLRERIAVSEPEGEPKRRRRVPRLPSGSLIVIFSTFLDDEAVQLAQGWRSTGHRVIAVDVLPRLEIAHLDPRQRIAFRIVAMERADRRAELQSSDVDVVRWIHDPADPGSLPIAAALTTLARKRVRR